MMVGRRLRRRSLAARRSKSSCAPQPRRGKKNETQVAHYRKLFFLLFFLWMVRSGHPYTIPLSYCAAYYFLWIFSWFLIRVGIGRAFQLDHPLEGPRVESYLRRAHGEMCGSALMAWCARACADSIRLGSRRHSNKHTHEKF